MQSVADKITGILAFAAIWQIPLTKAELESFLAEPLPDDALQHFFCYQDGEEKYFSLLSDGDALKKRKKETQEYSEKLREKAEKFVRILKFFPFLRGVALTNTPAMGFAGATSDIDLFLIVKKGRIWTARFFATLFFTLLGLRPKKNKDSGKFCLSFFVDEEFTDFTSLKLPQDIYLAFWCLTLKPFWGRHFFGRFGRENAVWIRKEFELSRDISENFIWNEEKEKSPLLQKIWEFLLPYPFEKLCRKLLLKKAVKFLDSNSPEYSPDMILNDQMQKLHQPDRREEIREKWKKLVRNYTAGSGL